MTLEKILFILATILPLFYTLSFWLFAIQLKEYRWDRFKEYILTPQGKKAILNFWFFIELPLLLLSIWVFFHAPLEIIVFPVVFFFLVIHNIFVIWKIARKRILFPKKTMRLLLTIWIINWVLALAYFSFIALGAWQWIYTFVIGTMLFTPVVIYACIALTLPLVNIQKKRQMTRASSISSKIQTVQTIWITGSYGKSWVKEMLATMLDSSISPHPPSGTQRAPTNVRVSPQREEEKSKVLKTPENINTELGVSNIVINNLTEDYDYFVAEMWAYRIGEISLLWTIVNHKYWFLTAIWNQHIWLFWSQKNIIQWKFEIAEKVLANNGTLYVNGDNRYIQWYLAHKDEEFLSHTVTYWIDWEDLAAVSEITGTQWGKTVFTFRYKKEKFKLEVALIWKHHIINLTWVLACCVDLWVELEDIKKWLAELKSENITTVWNTTFIDQTYNLSEAWLLAGLDVLNSFWASNPPLNPLPSKEGRAHAWPVRILVMDDILELGKESEQVHYDLWKKIAAEKLADKVLFVWVNYKSDFEKGVNDAGVGCKCIHTLQDTQDQRVILFEWRNAKKYLQKLKK